MGCWQSQTVRNLLLQHLNSLSFQKWAGNLQGTFALGCQEVWGSDLVLGHSVFFPIPVLPWGYQTERLFLQEIPQSWGGTSAPLEVLHSHTLCSSIITVQCGGNVCSSSRDHSCHSCTECKLVMVIKMSFIPGTGPFRGIGQQCYIATVLHTCFNMYQLPPSVAGACGLFC